MNTSIVAVIISAVATISGIVLGWSGRSRTVLQDTVTDAGKDAVIRADLEHIKRGIEDIRFEQRALVQRSDLLAERVTRIEELVKQAHKRIDKLEDDH
ncbi:hypothetical protein H8B09_02680 [Paenibacillus sp. PR3]|uniref:Uncharacterized protein n=1 Tax=Paenibacillus terricola TaxID=2763503 RepID=A0ABR8MNX8_9BACL|nr:hypothetical protein [Paenibacillus terricola]MBD3917643.1 hypothetical protein [Paenibacillus terricola]